MFTFTKSSVAGLLLMSACACSNAKTPPQAGESLLRNGGLTEMDGDMPAGWPLGGVTDPENYQVKLVQDFFGEPKAVEMSSHMAETSRYLSQELEVVPGARYEWQAQINQEGGAGLMWVKAIAGTTGEPVSWEARTYLTSYHGHPLHPDFVEGRLMRGSGQEGWRTEKVIFNVPQNVSRVRLSVGVYFSTGVLRIGPMALLKLSNPSKQ